jgi:hypothetical protein
MQNFGGKWEVGLMWLKEGSKIGCNDGRWMNCRRIVPSAGD